ncbi:MAG: hypothetical protein WC181_08260 [Defluviitoga sp.]|jgi:hypothetical protein
MEQKKEFTGLFIPAHIIEDEDLTLSDMAIYSEIACFNICFKTNTSLGKRWKLKANTVSKIVSKLKKKGYVEELSFNGRQRKLRALRDRQSRIKIQGRVGFKSKAGCDLNPSPNRDNNKDNNIDNNSYKEKEIIKEKEKPINYNLKDKELADYIFTETKKRYPFTKDKTEKQMEKEYEEMNRLHRLDGFEYDVIKAVAVFSQEDNFWQQNIRSVSKFRIKFEELLIKAQAEIKRREKYKIIEI